MQDLTPQGQSLVEDLARRHGTEPDAVATLLRALVAGGGTMAQFSHPALGGMGQWSQGGMIMVGDMFNHGLKAKVDAICNELAAALRQQTLFAAPVAASGQMQQQGGAGMSMSMGGGSWWPAELGAPASVGGQNDQGYAYFPATRRLAIRRGGKVTIYDTQDHQIGGVSQQQGGGASLSFSSQRGQFQVDSLPVVSGDAAAPASAPSEARARPQPQHQSQEPAAVGPVRAPAPPAMAAPTPAVAEAATGAGAGGDPLAMLERLASLKEKGILTEAEFAAKKAELLKRL